MIKITRMTTILLRPAVLFTVVLLLLAAGGPAKAADVLGSFDSFTFGDCSADPSGKMFCSAVTSGSGSTPLHTAGTVLFSVDLNLAMPVYTQHLPLPTGVPSAAAILQLAHGGDGTLYGHDGAEDSLYYISLVPESIGTRTKVLDPAAGVSGTFRALTDFSTFNPLCECECEECDGGLIELTLQFTGSATTAVIIQAAGQGSAILFNADVDPFDTITLVGMLPNGRLENGLNVFENKDINDLPNAEDAFFHTSCSLPVSAPGVTDGNFLVLDAINVNGSTVCAVD